MSTPNRPPRRSERISRRVLSSASQATPNTLIERLERLNIAIESAPSQIQPPDVATSGHDNSVSEAMTEQLEKLNLGMDSYPFHDEMKRLGLLAEGPDSRVEVIRSLIELDRFGIDTIDIESLCSGYDYTEPLFAKFLRILRSGGFADEDLEFIEIHVMDKTIFPPFIFDLVLVEMCKRAEWSDDETEAQQEWETKAKSEGCFVEMESAYVERMLNHFIFAMAAQYELSTLSKDQLPDLFYLWLRDSGWNKK